MPLRKTSIFVRVSEKEKTDLKVSTVIGGLP